MCKEGCGSKTVISATADVLKVQRLLGEGDEMIEG